MKNLFTLFCLLWFWQASAAQQKVAAFINPGGDLNFRVEQAGFFIAISPRGDILGYSININGAVSYDLNGRIVQVGDVRVSYNLHGKIDRINNIPLDFDLNNV